MKNTIYYFFLIMVFSFMSCEKQEEIDLRTECQKNNIGYITFRNQSKHAFDVYINDKHYKQQPGNSYIKKVPFNAGKTYEIYVRQAAGYIFYPTEKTFNVTINTCDEKEVAYTN